MKAATKKNAAAPARARRAKAKRSFFARVPTISLTRRQWIAAAAVAGVLLLGAGGYFAWRAYSNQTVDYPKLLRVSPAFRSYQVALLAMQGNRQKEAEDAFLRALTEDPSNAIIYDELAKLYLAQGEVQKALTTAENGVNKAPGSPDLYYTLGLARYQSGRFDDAERTLRKALDMRPEFPNAALWLGNTYLIQSKLGGGEGGDSAKLADAIAQFRRAVELDSEVAEYHSALAEGLYQRRDLAEARSELERALELDPNNAKYSLSLGKVCDQLNDLDAAAAAFRKATERDRTSADAFYGLGLACFKQQRDAEAVDALRSALEVNPYHADAHEKLGQTLIRLGQQEEGQRELVAAEDSRARAKKIDELRRASASDPGNAELANNLGIELARQGDYEEAMQAFQRAISGNPRFVDAQYQIGGLYTKRGNVLAALQAFMTVDRMQPGYRLTNYYLAKLNEKIGRKSEADKRTRMFEEQKKNGTVTEN